MAFPMRKAWNGIAKRLGIRKSGLLKLRHDVRRCEYKDVQVMWEMLNKNELELGHTYSSGRDRKTPFWDVFSWARRAPYLCRSF